MGPQSRAASGWPFLVAAGRRRDYSILLAPEFLVAGLEYGFLETVARPFPETDPASVVDLDTPGRRRVTVVYRTHRLTAADLVADTAATGTNPRDEHGRPLLLIYGFVCPDGWIPEPADVDLDAALGPALDTYRSFRADEQQAAVTPSWPFDLRSPVTGWPPRPGVPTTEPHPTHPPRRPARWPILAGLAAVSVAAILVWGRAAPSPERPSCSTASTTTSVSATATASCPGRPGDVSGSPERAP